MPQQNIQDPSIDTLDKVPAGELSSDQHAAALGFITTLSQGLLPQDEPQDDETQDDEEPQDTTPAGQPDPQQDIQSVEDNIITEIRGLKSEMGNEDLKAEFQVIKNEIESILNEDDTTKETTA